MKAKQTKTPKRHKFYRFLKSKLQFQLCDDKPCDFSTNARWYWKEVTCKRCLKLKPLALLTAIILMACAPEHPPQWHTILDKDKKTIAEVDLANRKTRTYAPYDAVIVALAEQIIAIREAIIRGDGKPQKAEQKHSTNPQPPAVPKNAAASQPSEPKK